MLSPLTYLRKKHKDIKNNKYICKVPTFSENMTDIFVRCSENIKHIWKIPNFSEKYRIYLGNTRLFQKTPTFL